MSMKEFVDKVNGMQSGDISRYEIKGLVGSGSYGKVYEVYRDGKRYAMKIPINMDFNVTIARVSDDVIRSYKKEASSWAELSDQCPDSVIRFIDYNVEPFPWMVMEFGETDLKSFISEGKVTVRDIISLLVKLQKIHDIGIIHRDIKPENIMLVNGEWKFTDFGLARAISNMTQTMSGVGSAEYMAPEQWSPKRFGQPDFTTDVWAVGIILYRVLTGLSPYQSGDLMELAYEVTNDGPDFDEIPQEYRTVLRKVLSIKRDGRYQSAIEFAQALSEVSGEKLPSHISVYKGSSGYQDVQIRGHPPVPQDTVIAVNVTNDGIAEYNGLTFKLNNSKLKLIKYSGLWDKVEIPAVFSINYNIVPVTAIDKDVFRDQTGLTSVVIPDGVTEIGDNAFTGCTSLRTVVIPDSVTKVGSGILEGCTSIEKIGTSADNLTGIDKIGPSLLRYGIDVSKMAELGFSVKILYDTGYSVQKLLEYFELNDMIDAGVPISEFLDSNNNILQLLAIGYSAKQLKEFGCSALKLKESGVSFKELIDAGYTAYELKLLGLTVNDTIKIKHMSNYDLRKMGYSAKELIDGLSVPLGDLRIAGYTAKELKEIGCTIGDLKKAGYSASELKDAGFSLKDFIMNIKSLDNNHIYVRGSNNNAFSYEELRNAGFSLKDLSDFGAGAFQLRLAGYSAKELRDIGCSAAELRSAGYTVKQLSDAGIGKEELKLAGYTVKELKDSGLTIKEVKEIHSIPIELIIGAGYSIKEMKDGGFTASELKYRYSASDLKSAGYSCSDLKDAGFTSKELKAAGFTKDELRAAGFKGLFL